MDDSSLESHVQISLNIFKCIGLVPWEENVKGWKRVICMIQYYLLVCVALQLMYNLFSQMPEVIEIFKDLDRGIAFIYLVFCNFTMFPKIMGRRKILPFLRMKPDVVTSEIGDILGQAKRNTLRQYICVIVSLIFCNLLLTWTDMTPTNHDSSKNSTLLLETQIQHGLMTNVLQVFQWIWAKYVIIVVTVSNMASSLLVMTVLNLIDCYFGHLIESVKKARVRRLSFIKRNIFMSERNRDVIDINYIVCVHQFIIK
jgi:hypothetical protein